eukprot:6209691-Pleurochrysis_carterae.AAC.2
MLKALRRSPETVLKAIVEPGVAEFGQDDTKITASKPSASVLLCRFHCPAGTFPQQDLSPSRMARSVGALTMLIALASVARAFKGQTQLGHGFQQAVGTIKQAQHLLELLAVHTSSCPCSRCNSATPGSTIALNTVVSPSSVISRVYMLSGGSFIAFRIVYFRSILSTAALADTDSRYFKIAWSVPLAITGTSALL